MSNNESHLQSLSTAAEVIKLLSEGCQDGVDGREDRAAVAGSHQELGDGRHDADGGLWANRLQSCIQWCQNGTVNDLRLLHGLARCQIESGHVPADVVVTDDRNHPWHHDEVEPRWIRTMKTNRNTCFVSIQISFWEVIGHVTLNYREQITQSMARLIKELRQQEI